MIKSTALFSVLLLCGNVNAVTFKIATLSPEGSAWTRVLREHAQVISQRTHGEVKFKFYPGGVMGDDKAVVRKMRVGQLHGAVLTSGGLVQNYSDIALYNLPMLFRNEAEVDYVRAVIDERLMAGLRAAKFVGFGLAEVGFAYPMSQKPVTSVAAIRQTKVWTPDNDPGSLRAFEAFRISPIPLPIVDVLAGLQTGLIDSVTSPPIGAIILQWHTQVAYGLELPLMYVYGTFAMTERAFKKMPAAHQAIVMEEMQQAVAKADKSARQDHNDAKSALTQQGMQWVKPSKAELEEWVSLANIASEKLVATGYVSADLYKQVLELLAQFRASGG